MQVRRDSEKTKTQLIAELEALRAQVSAFEQTACTQRQQQLQLGESVANLWENISDAVMALDNCWRFIYVNGKAEQLLQSSRNHLMGQKVWDIFPADAPYYSHFERAIASQSTVEFETFCRSLNCWCALRIYPCQWGILCHFQDITERKQAEERLRLSETWYRRIVETVHEGIWIIDKSGLTDFVNPRMAEILGYTVEEMRGRPLFDFMDEAAQREAEQHLERRRQGIKELHDFRFCHKSGSDVWTLISTNAILDEQGEFLGALAMVTDITQRKKAEAALRKAYDQLESLVQERTRELTKTNQLLIEENIERQRTEAAFKKEQEFLKVLLENVQAGIVACDAEGFLTLFNQAARKFHGLTEQSIPAEEWAQQYDLYLPDGKTLMKPEDIPLFRAWQGEKLHNVEMMIIPKQGIPRTLLASGQAIIDANGRKQGAVVVMHDITERQQAEKALRENQEQLARIFETIPDGLTLLNCEGKIIKANVAAEQILGLTSSEMLDRVYNDPEWHITSVDGQPFPEAELPFVRVMQTGQPVYEVEHAINYPDGRRKILCINAAPIRNDAGEIVNTIAALSDITHRKRTESALQASEQKFRTTFLAAPIGIVLVALDTSIQESNPMFQQMLGYSAEELRQKRFTDITHADDVAANLALHQELVTGQRDRYQLEKRYIHKQGHLIWANVNVTLVRDTSGTPQFCIAMIEDVTLAKQAQEALRESEERYRSVIESAAEGIVWQYADGSILTCNTSAENILGLSADQMRGRTSIDARWGSIYEDGSPFPGELHPSMVTLRTGEPQSNVVMGIHKPDGTLTWISINTRPMFRPNETAPYAVVSSFFDITDRKEAEEERAKLIQAQTARAEAEVAQQRSAFLAEASTILASSLNYENTLKSIVHLVVPFLADYCLLYKLDDNGQLQPVAATHHNPQKEEVVQQLLSVYRTYVQNPNSLIAQVIRTRKPLLVSEYTYEMAVAMISDPRLLEFCRQLEPKSFMLLPLTARSQIMGVMLLVTSDSGRRYSSSELSLGHELARRAAIAIDNAQLYWTAQQARQAAESAADRTARLQSVTAALSQSLTLPQVAEVIVEQGITVLGATAALVVRVAENGKELEIVSAVGYDSEKVEQWRRFPISTPSPLAEAVRTGQPVWEESTAERISRYPHLAQAYANYNFGAWISIPLMIEGQAVGGMTLGFAQVQQLSEDDRAFVLVLAQQCAQAIYRSRLYEAEQVARTAAEAANRVKDEFLAIVSHELRTPLNSILGWSQMLRTRKFDAATTAKALEIIERNARSQTQLIEDLLDVSRIMRGKIKLNIRPINLVSLIRGAIETVRLTAETKQIQILETLPTTSLQVMGDAERLQQVVWNLLSNAVKFTPEGGCVEVRVLAIAETSPSTPHHAQIQIIDTGIGIEPEFLPHVFERFRQADGSITRAHGGLGLGLAIVRHLVELHGGTVQADSEGAGKGTTFTVQLPLPSRAEEGGQSLELNSFQASLTTHPSALSGLRVLVVDDEADNREFLTFVLAQNQAQVTAAASAGEALQLLQQLQPDILISDLGMPSEDGYTLIQKVRALEVEGVRNIPAIALTAYAREEDRLRALQSGFQMHLAKPIEANKLVQAIASLWPSQPHLPTFS